MNNFKAQKAFFVSMIIMSVFISSSLVYGASNKPGEVASIEVLDDGAGMTNQGIITLVNGMSGTATASTLLTGFQADVVVFTEAPSAIGTTNGKIRTAKVHSGSGGCQESCSLY